MVDNLLDTPVDSPRREELPQRTETGPPPLPDRRHDEDEPRRLPSTKQNAPTWLRVAIIGGVLLYLFFVAALAAVGVAAYFTFSNQLEALSR